MQNTIQHQHKAIQLRKIRHGIDRKLWNDVEYNRKSTRNYRII